MDFLHYTTSENLNVMDFQISAEAHDTGESKRVSTQTDKINRQRVFYALWRFVSLPDFQQNYAL